MFEANASQSRVRTPAPPSPLRTPRRRPISMHVVPHDGEVQPAALTLTKDGDRDWRRRRFAAVHRHRTCPFSVIKSHISAQCFPHVSNVLISHVPDIGHIDAVGIANRDVHIFEAVPFRWLSFPSYSSRFCNPYLFHQFGALVANCHMRRFPLVSYLST